MNYISGHYVLLYIKWILKGDGFCTVDMIIPITISEHYAEIAEK